MCVSLIVLWPYGRRRVWLLAAAALYLVVAVATRSYFIPGVVALFQHAGAGLTPQQIAARASAWIFWDRVRFALIVAAWLCGLQAYRAAGVRAAAPASAAAPSPNSEPVPAR